MRTDMTTSDGHSDYTYQIGTEPGDLEETELVQITFKLSVIKT